MYDGRKEGRGGKNRKEDSQRVDDKIVQEIEKLQNLRELGAKKLNDNAKEFAESIEKELKTAQIRRIFGAVKKMQMEFKKKGFKNEKVILLKPKLAYASNKKKEVKPLKNILVACIDRIGDGEEGYKDFENFVNFFEAILAYHKGR